MENLKLELISEGLTRIILEINYYSKKYIDEVIKAVVENPNEYIHSDHKELLIREAMTYVGDEYPMLDDFIKAVKSVRQPLNINTWYSFEDYDLLLEDGSVILLDSPAAYYGYVVLYKKENEYYEIDNNDGEKPVKLDLFTLKERFMILKK